MGGEDVLILEISAPGLGSVTRALERSPARLGRERGVELLFDYPWLSRVHLVFERVDDDVDGASWHVRREGRNEVRLNGAALEGARAIAPGDRLALGPMTITIASAALLEADTFDGLPPLTLELPLASLYGGADDLALAASTPRLHLTRLGEAARALGALADERAVASEAARVAVDALSARAAAVLGPTLGAGASPARAADAGPLCVLGASGALPGTPSAALAAHALRTRRTLGLDDASASPAFRERASVAGALVGPALVAPLGAPAEGVLYVDRAAGASPFTEDDAVFATVLAQLVGSALAAAGERARAAAASARVAAERSALRREVAARGGFGRLVGTSAPIQALAAALAKVAPTTATVLIHGETGSGKELVARELHARSPRHEAPFLAVNSAALPDTLLESELFGHRRGAFSGADEDRRGLFEAASGGTVFLDEVAELSLAAQAKLLRVLEQREVVPLGSTRPIAVDVRVVAATHVDLAAAVRAGRFRQDLYYRLSLFPLEVPPLRARREDLPALVASFLARSAEARTKQLAPPTPAALDALARHDWPGNVRELAHVVERAAILADDGAAIDLEHLPEELVRRPSTTARRAATPTAGEAEGLFTLGDGPSPPSLPEAVADFERALIIRELDRDGWNRTRTAKRLGVSRRAFMDKLRRYAIEEPASPPKPREGR